MTTKTVKIYKPHFHRIIVSLNDSLGCCLEEDWHEFIDELEGIEHDCQDDYVELDEDTVQTLCSMYSTELERYSVVLRDFADRDVLNYVPILDYVEELACICEGLQYLLNNRDFQGYFWHLRRELLKEQRELKQ